jgi:cell division protein FtsI (penicillin-binding protein 3)/stage V sporulation protein D (sporulation-specific penicillin-binding protein)
MIEEKLAEAVDNYNAKSGVIIIVEPSTGAIISLANYPNFDPANYEEAIEQEELVRNDAISTVYEPGSVMKSVTVASAIDAGKISENSVYNDTGPRIFSGHVVDNWDGKHHGEETVTEILQHSNNLGAAWVSQQLGGESLMQYFRNFGYGQTTGIDLEGEERGLIYSTDKLKDIELVNASFGQGISLTPLQVTMSFAAIANDGLMMKPYLVRKIVTNDKEVEFKPRPISRPITSNTAERMVSLLTSAVSGGEAKFFVSKKYSIAGKTGTAQVPTSGGYDADRTNATFVGFLPSYKNFVLFVKLEEPTSPSGYAAETAVPLWMNIVEKLAAYYGLAADKL